MDIAELTKTLAPFIPYLVQAGQSFGDEAATRFGAEAWAHVQGIWARLAERLAGKPAAKEAVDDVANRPEDTRAQGALELQLEKLFDGSIPSGGDRGPVGRRGASAGDRRR